MSSLERDAEIIVQNLKNMQDGLLAGRMPEDAAVWEQLLENPVCMGRSSEQKRRFT